MKSDEIIVLYSKNYDPIRRLERNSLCRPKYVLCADFGVTLSVMIFDPSEYFFNGFHPSLFFQCFVIPFVIVTDVTYVSLCLL